MNSEIFEKELLLTRVDFDKNQKPRLKLGDISSGKIHEFSPIFDEKITLEIDNSERFCIEKHRFFR